MGDIVTFVTTNVMLPRFWAVDHTVSLKKEARDDSSSSVPSWDPATLNFNSMAGKSTLVCLTVSSEADVGALVDGKREGLTGAGEGLTGTGEGATDIEGVLLGISGTPGLSLSCFAIA
jgi:hypothetical protein